MSVNRALWNVGYTNIPSYPCPTCTNGRLNVRPETLNAIETGPSIHEHHLEAWDPDWIVKRFSALLECQNSTCGELVSFGGKVHVEQDYSNQDERDYYDIYRPSYFSPAIPIFPIPDVCPSSVQNELTLSFTHFWSDAGASANRLRTAIEALLTDQKIPRTTVNKSRKRVTLTLHSRIEKFASEMPEAAKMLMAIKWIGNAGSHDSWAMDRNSLLDGYELFEHVVELLYERRTARLNRTAADITKRKGRPVSKRKKMRPRLFPT